MGKLRREIAFFFLLFLWGCSVVREEVYESSLEEIDSATKEALGKIGYQPTAYIPQKDKIFYSFYPVRRSFLEPLNLVSLTHLRLSSNQIKSTFSVVGTECIPISEIVNLSIQQELAKRKGAVSSPMKKKDVGKYLLLSLITPGLGIDYLYQKNPYTLGIEPTYTLLKVIYFLMDGIFLYVAASNLFKENGDSEDITCSLISMTFLRAGNFLALREMNRYHRLVETGYNYYQGEAFAEEKRKWKKFREEQGYQEKSLSFSLGIWGAPISEINDSLKSYEEYLDRRGFTGKFSLITTHFGCQGGMQFRVNHHLALKADIGILQSGKVINKVRYRDTEETLAYSLTSFPLAGNIKILFPLVDSLNYQANFYTQGGVTHYWTQYKFDYRLNPDIAEVNPYFPQKLMGKGVGWQAGGGVEIFFPNRLVCRFEFLYQKARVSNFRGKVKTSQGEKEAILYYTKREINGEKIITLIPLPEGYYFNLPPGSRKAEINYNGPFLKVALGYNFW